MQESPVQKAPLPDSGSLVQEIPLPDSGISCIYSEVFRRSGQ